MAKKSFTNNPALNFISSAQPQQEKQPEVKQKEVKAKQAKTATKPTKEKTDAKPEAEKITKPEQPIPTLFDIPVAPEKTAKTTKPAKPAKAEKPTPKTPDLPMLNLNIPVVERKSTRIQLLIKPSLVEKLKAIAKAKNTSVNDLVNVILETVLK